jgi:hypothetical protein
MPIVRNQIGGWLQPERKNMTDTLKELRSRLQTFVDERDWQQFHSPKNLAMAMIVEAAELVEHFQWMTEQESRELTPGDRRYLCLFASDSRGAGDRHH